ncbi:MAG: hypothetical protein VKK42_17775 [Lyngbya sp.]|nr:hypothetical protein [Lyngbya sp.]
MSKKRRRKSNKSKQNSALNTSANIKVHHASLDDIKKYSPEKIRQLERGGIRQGASRSEIQTQQMLEKVPPSHRAGIDGKSATTKLKEYLDNKDASHIVPYSKGGSNDPKNIKWEDKKLNQARHNKPMTRQEQYRLDAKAHLDNLTGALKAGVDAVPQGTAIGAMTTAPFSMLRNGLRVIRGEISVQKATLETLKDTTVGGATGAVTALTLTTVASACPPIAIALGAVSPALLVCGGAGMVYEFFKILGDHNKRVKAYYKSLTQQELQRLQAIENQLIYEHQNNLKFLAQAKYASDIILNRPCAAGIDGALDRLYESISIVNSLGNPSKDKKLFQLIADSQKPLLKS